MFKIKRVEYKFVDSNGNANSYYLAKDLYDHIMKLENELQEAKNESFDAAMENAIAKHELEMIKPVVESKQLEPAVSPYCRDCKFCIKDFRDIILGCAKNAVCDDYVKKE